MFDPTIFENWKVVVEGAIYDLDRERLIEVVGRQDLVDLAGMSRTFRMSVQLPGGQSQAELILTSELSDFIGEWYPVRVDDDQAPGIRIALRLTLPGERIRGASGTHDYLQTLWGDGVEMVHRVQIRVDPRTAASIDSSYSIIWTSGMKTGSKICRHLQRNCWHRFGTWNPAKQANPSKRIQDPDAEMQSRSLSMLPASHAVPPAQESSWRQARASWRRREPVTNAADAAPTQSSGRIPSSASAAER